MSEEKKGKENNEISFHASWQKSVCHINPVLKKLGANRYSCSIGQRVHLYSEYTLVSNLAFFSKVEMHISDKSVLWGTFGAPTVKKLLNMHTEDSILQHCM